MAATADEIMAVHEELAALVQAGVPLEAGLHKLAREFPWRLRQPVQDLAQRLSQGESLPEALQGSQLAGFSAYATAFGVALRSRHPGRLLPALTATGRRSLEFTRSMAMELIYPLVLLITGVALITFSLDKTAPSMLNIGRWFGTETKVFDLVTNAVGENSFWRNFAIWMLPLGAFAMGFILWQARSAAVGGNRWMWPFAKLRLVSANGIFCDVLALLVESEIPLVTALPLAGEATNWPQFELAARSMAHSVSRGERTLRGHGPLSKYVVWLIQSTSRDQMVAELRREADRCRTAAERIRQWHVAWLPFLVTLATALFTVTMMCVINLGPFISILLHMAQPGAIQ